MSMSRASAAVAGRGVEREPPEPQRVERRVETEPGDRTRPVRQVPRASQHPQSRQRRPSVVARASMDTESSAPSNATNTCAAPRSDRPRAVAPASGPANQVTSESSASRLSALKSSDTTPLAGRAHPRLPAPVVRNPGRPMLSESTYTWPPAKWSAARPVSSAAPTKLERESVAVSAPTGGAALSRATSPAMVKLRREPGALATQRAKSMLRARRVKSRTPERDASSMRTPSMRTAPAEDSRSAWDSSAAKVPSSVMGPVTAPRSRSAGSCRATRRMKVSRARTSAKSPIVSVRVSSPTVPLTMLIGRAPSRCVSVPVNRASCNPPVSVPAAPRSPCSRTAGARRRIVPKSTVATSTANGWKRIPPVARRSISPLPRRRDAGQPATSESRNVQSTSSASAFVAPSAVVCPERRP